MDDPDLGNWEYEYDDAGNLIRQTDAGGNEVQLEYDVIDRLTEKSAGSTVIAYTYDEGTIGVLTGMHAPSLEMAYEYDERLRPIREVKIMGSEEFVVEREFDRFDRVVSEQMGNEEIEYAYRDLALRRVNNDITFEHNEFYLPTEREYSNSLTTVLTYDPVRPRMESIVTNNLQNLRYNYDLVGNVLGIDDQNNGFVLSMGYDDIDRLAQVERTGDEQVYTAVYEYDSIGNMLSSVAGEDRYLFTYTSNPAHSPTRVNAPAPDCAENEVLEGGRCVLREGCAYNNPACEDSYDCRGNACVEIDSDADGIGILSDCRDDRIDIYPGAAEICDALDNDCDGSVDENFDLTGVDFCGSCGVVCEENHYCDAGSCRVREGCYYDNPACEEEFSCIDNECVEEDADGDGVGILRDCNDNNSSINPNAAELCDALDNNCNGEIDEVFDFEGGDYCGVCGVVCDADEYCNARSCQSREGCRYNNPSCGVGYQCVDNECVLRSGCAYNNPACEESYECRENACVEIDSDADGIGILSDCRDDRADTYPGAAEICDALDNDCDGSVDENFDFTGVDFCGSCGVVCEENHYCNAGSCRVREGCYYDPSVCAAGQQCIVNECFEEFFNEGELPDISIERFHLINPTAVAGGEEAVFELTIKNIGAQTAEDIDWQVSAIYDLERWEEPGGLEILATSGDFPIDQLEVGEEMIVYPEFIYPCGIIIAVVDLDNEILERSELNNIITLRPDQKICSKKAKGSPGVKEPKSSEKKEKSIGGEKSVLEKISVMMQKKNLSKKKMEKKKLPLKKSAMKKQEIKYQEKPSSQKHSQNYKNDHGNGKKAFGKVKVARGIIS